MVTGFMNPILAMFLPHRFMGRARDARHLCVVLRDVSFGKLGARNGNLRSEHQMTLAIAGLFCSTRSPSFVKEVN